MPVRKAIHENEGIYFLTFTCARWINLFQITNGYDVVYNWFDYLKNSGHFVLGYVIMPNHLHAVLAFRNSGKSINSIVGNGKRFMAYELVKKLEQLKKVELLKELSTLVNKTDAKRNKRHEVFEPSFDWKECLDSKFIEQKLNYIHDNPCQEHWNLVVSPSEYLHSSAKYYIEGKPGFYPITSYTEMEDVDLSERTG